MGVDSIVFGNTALEIFPEFRQNQEWSAAAQLSNSLTMAVIWKFGGFYSDLDVMVERDLSHFENVFGSYRNSQHMYLCNGVFHFEKRHPLIGKVLEIQKSDYPNRKEGRNARLDVSCKIFTRFLQN